MKIGILTYHRVVNDGSILQAYCGQKALSRQFPDARVEIIDYCPAKLWWTEHRKIIGKRPPFFRPKMLAKIKSVNRFIKDYLVLSPKSCSTDDLPKAVNFIEEQNYDAVFVGSDTVWEARNSRYAPHPPNIYYLPGLNSIKKISYAASADPLHSEFIANQKQLASIASHIKNFDYITVRDKTTKNYLIQLGVAPEDIHFMPDPTLQYDFNELVQKPQINKQRPWAGVGYGGAVKKAAIAQLKQKGYDIIDLGNFTLNGKPIPGAAQSVNIRLGVFPMLDFLITDRFHSSILTVKLAEAPVVFVESSQKWPDPNSKGRDLFQRVGIEPMVWRYEGQEIPSDLIAKYMHVWNELRIDLKKSFCALRDEVSFFKQLNQFTQKT
ncbi:MAG: polysaccharide pyruvyl transferase family protein [Desulfotomaculaceae bacterium]|nr:polysaccharide pyruvyl transferase family protein [Desulfotomaculaceae bacterium]